MLKAIDEHQEQALQQDKVPQHVAITMDGNEDGLKRGLPHGSPRRQGFNKRVKFCA